MKLISLVFILICNSAFGSNLFYSESSIPHEHRDMNLASKYSYSFVMKYCGNSAGAFSEITRSGIKSIALKVDPFEGVGAALDYGTRSDVALLYREAVESDDLERVAEAIKYAYDDVFNNAKEYVSRRDHLSDHMSLIIHSQGYFLGLDTCFGNKQLVKDQFTAGLIFADTLGKASGGSIGVLLWLGIGKLGKWLSEAAGYVAPKTVSKLTLAFKASPFVAVSVFGIFQTYNLIDKKLKAIEAKGILDEESKKKLIEVESDLAELYQLQTDPDSQLTLTQKQQIKELILSFEARLTKIKANL